MASKRKPLDDARRRVKEKLNAIDEQKDFIQNSVEQLTSGVIDLIINRCMFIVAVARSNSYFQITACMF